MAQCFIPLTPTQFASLSGTSQESLLYMGSVMQSPLSRATALAIHALNLDLPPIVFGPIPAMEGGKPPGGRYTASLRGMTGATISSPLNKLWVEHEVLIDSTKMDLYDVLHEYVHAATMRLLLEPQTKEHIQIRRRLEQLMKYAESQLPEVAADEFRGYGFKDVYEFVAELRSNPEFQNELRKLKLGDAPSANVLQAAWDYILRLFGIGPDLSVLDKTYELSGKLFGQEQYGPRGLKRLLTEKGHPQGAQMATEARGKAGQSQQPQQPQQPQPRALPQDAIAGHKNNQRTHVAYPKDPGNPQTLYTLYPVTPQYPGGVKGAGLKNQSRADVEAAIQAAGSTVMAPVGSRPAKKGSIPQNTSTQRVGFSPTTGELQVAAYEQKDGTWLYYETDQDLYTDPNATVYKGLTRAQVDRFIQAKNVVPSPPTPGAVQPTGSTPTLLYQPANIPFRVLYANSEAALLNLSRAQEAANVPVQDRIEGPAVLRNNNVRVKNNEVHEKLVVPIEKEGGRIAREYGKTQDQVEEVMRLLHRIERFENKKRQWQRGASANNPSVVNRINKLDADITEAQRDLNNLNNPKYVNDVKQNLAPLMKKLSDDTLDRKVAYGMMPRIVAEYMKRAYDFYVPFQKGKKTKTGMFARGISKTGDYTFARLQQAAYETTARGELNVIRRYVGELVRSTMLATVDNPTEQVGYIAEDKVDDVKYDPVTNTLHEGATSHLFDENAIVYYTNGTRTTLIIKEPSLLEALHPYKGAARVNMLTNLMNIWSSTTRTVAIGKTALSPMFPPFNLQRDIGSAHINLPANVPYWQLDKALLDWHTWADAFANTFKDAVGFKMSGEFAEADRAGAFITRKAAIGDADVIANNIIAAFRPTVRQRFKKLTGWSKETPGTGGNLFKVITGWAQAIESTTRFAVYKAARDSGLSPEESAVIAKQSTVNFENRGVYNPSKMFMFAGAKIASLDQTFETGKDKGAAKMSAFVMSMVGMGVLFSYLGYKLCPKDKDGKSQYLKIPDYKKDSMALAGCGVFGWALPQELVAPAYIIGNAWGDSIWGGRTAASTASRILTGMVNSYWPGNVPQQDVTGHKGRPGEFIVRAIIPTTIMPFTDVMVANRDTWGREIVRDREKKAKEGMHNYQMGTGNESELAVNLAQGLYKGSLGFVDPAPQQLEYFNRYFNPFYEGTRFFRDLSSDRAPRYEGEVVNPITRKLTGGPTGFYDQDQFDELLARATQAEYLVRPPKNSGQKAVPLSELSPEEQALVKSADMLQRIQEDINKSFKGYKLMSKEMIEQRNARKKERMLEGIRRYNEIRDRMPK